MTACPTTSPSLAVSPREATSGADIVLTWANIKSPTVNDWFGMYIQGETNNQLYKDWAYINSTAACVRTPGDGKNQGTCTFTLSNTLIPGIYEFRLYSNNQYTALATSNPLTVITPSITPTPTGGLCPCPSPTPFYQTSGCNGPCISSQNCTDGRVCILVEGSGWVCRNPACVASTSCSCGTGAASGPLSYASNYVVVTSTPTRTPTPTSTEKGGTPTPTLSSATASGTPTPTGLTLGALPTPTPTPIPEVINPPLQVKPFADKSGQTGTTFTLEGTTDPLLDVDIRIDPDGFGHTTTADANGDWRLILTKSLTTGQKQLTVTARTNEGGQTQEKVTFTVKKSTPFFSLFIGFLVLAGLGAVGYFIYKKQMNDQSALFTNYPTTVPPTEEPSQPFVSEPSQEIHKEPSEEPHSPS